MIGSRAARFVQQHIASLRAELKVVFSKIKEELEDHLESINQNTIEIQSNYEYISQLTNRIEKIEQRLSALELRASGVPARDEHVETIVVTREEEELIALLLDSHHKRVLLTYEDVASRLGVSKTFSAHLIASLIEKGVPIEKKRSDGMVLCEIDPRFFDKKVRFNLVTIQ